MFELIKTFLKIGLIGFGGGSALIPVIEKEAVIDKNFVSSEKYTEETIIANITPGALPVKLSAAIGKEHSGALFSLLSAYTLAFPGVFISVILLSLIATMDKQGLLLIEYASIGISAFIIFLLVHYILKVLNTSKTERNYKIIIMLASAFLTCGKEIRALIYEIFANIPQDSLGKAFLDISTIDLLLLVFFIIFTVGDFSKYKNSILKYIRISLCVIISVFFVLLSGKGTGFSFPLMKNIIMYTMLLLCVVFTYLDAKSEKRSTNKIDIKGTLIVCSYFLAAILIFAAIAYILFGSEIIDYLKFGIISTVTSFGGGEAYLTVAHGLFVDGGFVSSDVFYSQMLPITNALPGPILVKLLSCIGYSFGAGKINSIGAAYILAILGFTIGIGFSCISYFLVELVYKAFSEIKVFISLKTWILPVICGMLITTMISMLSEMIKISITAGISNYLSLVVIVGILFTVYCLHKFLKLNDLIIILISGAVSIFAMLIL